MVPLGATHAPLNHCFLLKIFLEFFNTFFKKTLNFFYNFNTIMLSCIV
jgi:hypothetical protein